MVNKKVSAGALAAAGLAAFAYYKYTKMSEEEKSTMVSDLKEKAQNLYDQYAPKELKDLFNKKAPSPSPSSASSHFGEGNDYSSRLYRLEIRK